MRGHRMLLGPASYSDQTLLSSSSTIIWKKERHRAKKCKTNEVLQLPGLLMQNFCHLANTIILKTPLIKTISYSLSQQLSSPRLFTNWNYNVCLNASGNRTVAMHCHTKSIPEWFGLEGT